jgi:ubiquinone/menaquinone biosynthesis C-methylase UbiE
VGRLVGKDPGAYGYLPRSMGQFLSVAEFKALLAECGFPAEPMVEAQTLGIAHLVVARRGG